MDIQVQSQDIIVALSERIAALTVELETTKLGLRQAQEINKGLSELLVSAQDRMNGSPVAQLDTDESDD
jgi:hypothetical protein